MAGYEYLIVHLLPEIAAIFENQYQR